MRFSERYGYVPAPVELKDDEIPDSLRSGLWDVVELSYFERLWNTSSGRVSHFFPIFDHVSKQLWFGFFRETIDQRTDNPDRCKSMIKKKFFNFEFYQVYDFIEFIANLSFKEWSSFQPHEEFPAFCNKVLKREKAAFRFADRSLVKIADESELAEIHDALLSSSVGVSAHIKAAAAAYSRTPPDNRNCVKEAISAVESAVYTLRGKKSSGLAGPLKEIAKEYEIHPALSAGFEKLYGYSSDEEGVRHAIMERERITTEGARYMLVSCAAFSNYLISLKSD